MRPIVRDRPTEREEPDTDTRSTRAERGASADEDEIWLEVQEFRGLFRAVRGGFRCHDGHSEISP